ncbi:hypothetical protein FACS1894127_0180 [Clostridia bacterium]|nr:hypothetical protein FACS1894127_0180 [Clostridia bacterium]
MMAKMEIRMPEDFLLKLSRLADKTDEILPKVLEAGGEVALAKVKTNLTAVIGRGTKVKSRSTGELARSLGLSSAKQKRDGSGWDIKVGFAEPRSGGGSNAKIANILEYGRHGQPAKPFLKPAKTQSRNQAIEAMKAKLESEADKVTDHHFKWWFDVSPSRACCWRHLKVGFASIQYLPPLKRLSICRHLPICRSLPDP